MARLIGIYNADGGLRGEVAYVLGHMVGVTDCVLCDITHSPVRKKREWSALEARLREELGHEMVLLHRNETTDAQKRASAGREPCVLIEDEHGGLRMLADSHDLREVEGDVAGFDRMIRSKLATH